jgi:hypothetical protein
MQMLHFLGLWELFLYTKWCSSVHGSVVHHGPDNGWWWGLVGGELCGRVVVRGMLEREMMATWWSMTVALSGGVGRAVMLNSGEAVGDFHLRGGEVEVVVCG